MCLARVRSLVRPAEVCLAGGTELALCIRNEPLSDRAKADPRRKNGARKPGEERLICYKISPPSQNQRQHFFSFSVRFFRFRSTFSSRARTRATRSLEAFDILVRRPAAALPVAGDDEKFCDRCRNLLSARRRRKKTVAERH